MKITQKNFLDGCAVVGAIAGICLMGYLLGQIELPKEEAALFGITAGGGIAAAMIGAATVYTLGLGAIIARDLIKKRNQETKPQEMQSI